MRAFLGRGGDLQAKCYTAKVIVTTSLGRCEKVVPKVRLIRPVAISRLPPNKNILRTWNKGGTNDSWRRADDGEPVGGIVG